MLLPASHSTTSRSAGTGTTHRAAPPAPGPGSTATSPVTATVTGAVTVTVTSPATAARTETPGDGDSLGFPLLATKNTTRIDGSDPVADAVAVALAVFPSVVPDGHPSAVALAPTDDWQAAIAAASLMAAPFRAPLLLSGPEVLPAADVDALGRLAPAGNGALGGVQLIRIGDVPAPSGLKIATIAGAGTGGGGGAGGNPAAGASAGASPYALAAAIDRYEIAARGKASVNVIIASAQAPTYAMPAAGFAAESGEPILFVDASGVPAVTARQLTAHGHPHIYVLGPPSVIPATVLDELASYGTVQRVGADATSPAASSVAFAEYRDPPCAAAKPCGHLPRTFGWAIRSPGHGYVLIDASRPLDAAAAAALSSSGGYGPQLLVSDPTTLPGSVRDYLLNDATPRYARTGPTTTPPDHAWVIGGPSAISVGVQAEVDGLLETVPAQ
jgi:Cell wall binding domain 2 (CWB2)